ncbi:MAG: winged helix-turn-helix domain-containing protein [Anaerolineales bacterium]|nr:winged helix-turn-helix domain-containing protein [Anaerolineales bacterium]
MSHVNIPTFDKFMNPVIQALKQLGGSGTIEEINNTVIEIAKLSDEQLEILHDPEKGSQTEVEYRLAWARTYLKKYGVLENSSRGVWALTPKGRQLDQVNSRVVRRFVQNQKKKVKPAVIEEDELSATSVIQWFKNTPWFVNPIEIIRQLCDNGVNLLLRIRL